MKKLNKRNRTNSSIKVGFGLPGCGLSASAMLSYVNS